MNLAELTPAAQADAEKDITQRHHENVAAYEKAVAEKTAELRARLGDAYLPRSSIALGLAPPVDPYWDRTDRFWTNR